jgi:hypothetical protein
MAETMTIIKHPATRLTQCKYGDLLQQHLISEFLLADVKQAVNSVSLMSAPHIVAALGAPPTSTMAKVNEHVLLVRNWELNEEFLIEGISALPPSLPTAELIEESPVAIPFAFCSSQESVVSSDNGIVIPCTVFACIPDLTFTAASDVDKRRVALRQLK